MSENNHGIIQQLADKCLLSHFSDSLLLAGGWQHNHECLSVLWREEVDFAHNWPGDKEKVSEFLAAVPVEKSVAKAPTPKATPAAPQQQPAAPQQQPAAPQPAMVDDLD
jgi:hypothetical protein